MRRSRFAGIRAGKGVDVMYKTGEKPGKGTYQCTACGQTVVLDDNSDTLPPCPKCDGTTFRKL
jgi:DNA-directed RNA polymerase subunit RPC12/RpoP